MIAPSALNALIVTLMVLVSLFLLRMLAAVNAENPFGKGLAAIVS